VSAFSLTTRISLLFAVAAAAVLLATGAFLSRAVEQHFVETDRHELQGHLELVRRLLERVDSRQAFDHLPQRLDDALVGHHGLAVAVMDARERIWFATSGGGFPRALLRAENCADPPASVRCLEGGLRQWRQAGHDYRGMVAPLRAGNGEMLKVALALDIHHHELFMTRFHEQLGIAMALAALVTALLGWAATRRGLAPLHRVTELAAGISAEHLSRRLPTAGQPAELQPLIASFNAMLERLETSFQRLSAFSADIAHELRTPVSNLLTQAQVILGRDRSVEAYREALQSSAEEYERLARMIADMLFLAKADNRLLVPRREVVDLTRESRELIEFHGIVAEEKGVHLHLEGEATVMGDRIMLRRALSNLLSNAIRHCAAGGAVAVRLESGVDEVVVSVENPGDIAAEHLPRLFDRFYTGDPARRQGGEGAGLGLAIVRSIVAAHGGAITATSQGGLTRFVIRLPPGDQGAGLGVSR
jgi:two-component system heavy metal sensor histidine kinase CusS